MSRSLGPACPDAGPHGNLVITKAAHSARMRAAALSLIAVLLAASPALAGHEDKDKKAAPAPTVLMSPVAMPVVVDGRLVNYVFVTIRLQLSAGADSVKLRGMEPYFRDALVRAGHRTPFVRNDNYTLLDDDKLKAALLREAALIAGPGMVVSATINREQSMHFDGLPKPKSGAR